MEERVPETKIPHKIEKLFHIKKYPKKFNYFAKNIRDLISEANLQTNKNRYILDVN